MLPCLYNLPRKLLRSSIYSTGSLSVDLRINQTVSPNHCCCLHFVFHQEDPASSVALSKRKGFSLVYMTYSSMFGVLTDVYYAAIPYSLLFGVLAVFKSRRISPSAKGFQGFGVGTTDIPTCSYLHLQRSEYVCMAISCASCLWKCNLGSECRDGVMGFRPGESGWEFPDERRPPSPPVKTCWNYGIPC